jgi:hypothetical protein
MPKEPQGQKRPADTVADAIVLTDEIEEDTGDSGKDKAAQALGRKGGQRRGRSLAPSAGRKLREKLP